MNSILAAMLAAATYSTPTPQADVNAFLRFMWADERCPAFTINYEKTFDQVRGHPCRHEGREFRVRSRSRQLLLDRAATIFRVRPSPPPAGGCYRLKISTLGDRSDG
jgi:hypothetical protein